MLSSSHLTLKAPITTAADDILKYFFLFFKENKSWYSMWIICLAMWIVCLADNSHEIPRLVFFEKLKKIKIKCRLLLILLGALRVINGNRKGTLNNCLLQNSWLVGQPCQWGSHLADEQEKKKTKMITLTISACNMCTLMDSAGSDRPHQRTSMAGRELDSYKVEIAPFSETCLAKEIRAFKRSSC